jgi:hypothetical protein
MKSCFDVDPKLNGICEERFQNLLGEVKRFYCIGHPILDYDSASEKCKVLDGEKVCGGGFIQGSPDQIVISEGDTHRMSAGYCSSVSDNGACHGEASVKCVNGALVFGPSYCVGGVLP